MPCVTKNSRYFFSFRNITCHVSSSAQTKIKLFFIPVSQYMTGTAVPISASFYNVVLPAIIPPHFCNANFCLGTLDFTS